MAVQGAFRLRGWRFSTDLPVEQKYVLIVAPHTSNWDFMLMVGLGAALQRQARFMIKHTLFFGPLGSLLRWLGGIAVERSSSHNFVGEMVSQFEKTNEMVLIITPEGTRRRVDKWKGGFYHIAHGAGVAIVPVYLDYERREVGFGPAFFPTGDYEADLPEIQACYADVTARHPEMDGSKVALAE